MSNEDQRRPQYPQKPKPPPTDKKIARGFLALGQTFFNTYKAEIAKAEKDKDAERKWLKLGAKAAIVYTVITAVIMGINVYQASISKRQVRISEDTEIRQLRSYLGISKIEVVCCDLPNIEGPPREVRQIIRITVKNGGQTPSSDVRVRLGQLELPFFQPNISPNMNFDDPVSSGAAAITPFSEASLYILPGLEKSFAGPAATLPIMRAKSRQARVVIYGHVEGTNVFSERNVTDFCEVYSVGPDGLDNFEACPQHNNERPNKP